MPKIGRLLPSIRSDLKAGQLLHSMTIGTQQRLGSDDSPMVLIAPCGPQALLRQGRNCPDTHLNMPHQPHSLMQDANNGDG